MIYLFIKDRISNDFSTEVGHSWGLGLWVISKEGNNSPCLWALISLSSSETLKFYPNSASPMEWRKGTGLKSRKPGI